MNYDQKNRELEKKIEELKSTYTDSYGNKYPNMNHPKWKNQNGNPYIPLDYNGNMQKGYVG